MQTGELKYCERCNIQFECKAHDIANCQCSRVSLSPQSVDYLKAAGMDCLCLNCLMEIEQKHQPDSDRPGHTFTNQALSKTK